MITYDPVEAGGYGVFEGVTLSNTGSKNNTYGVRVDTTTVGGFARAYRFANLSSGTYATAGFGCYGNGNTTNYAYIYSLSAQAAQTPTNEYTLGQFRFYPNGMQMLVSDAPRLDWYELDSIANNRRMSMYSVGGMFSAVFMDDAGGTSASWLDVTRNGNYASTINLISSDLMHNGNSVATRLWVDEFYAQIGHSHTWASITSKPTTLSGFGITDGVTTGRTVGTQYSLTGGGALSANLLLNLVNDENSPAPLKYYGTDSSGIKGWFYLPNAGGSVTSVSVITANGLAGSVATATTTPAITLSTTITGLLKGNGTAISAAIAGTDYATGGHNHDATYVRLGPGATEVQNIGGYATFTGAQHFFRAAAGTAPGYFLATVSDPSTTARQVVTRTAAQVRTDIGAGTVTSVGLSVPSFLTISGSPVTTSGTLAISVTDQAPNSIFAGPSTGASASVPSFRALVVADIPTIPTSKVNNLDTELTDKLSKTSGGSVVGPLDAADVFRSKATQASGALTHFPAWGADPTSSVQTLYWRTAANFRADIGAGVGSVTSVGLSGISNFISVAGSPITSAGTLSLSLANQSANRVLAGPTSGGTTTPSFRLLVDADIPAAIVRDSRNVWTTHSIQGGSNLSADRTLSLVGDVPTPTASQYYGTNGASARGWYNLPVGVPTSRQINGNYSISGGGDLSADRTLTLDNDEATPAALKYYGTNSSGDRGWHALPSGSGGSGSGANVVGYFNVGITGSVSGVAGLNGATQVGGSGSTYRITHGLASAPSVVLLTPSYGSSVTPTAYVVSGSVNSTTVDVVVGPNNGPLTRVYVCMW